MNLPSRYTPTGRFFGGGQAIVSIWNDSALGREVAVKVLDPAGIGGSLRDEAAMLAAVQSKHVVELYEIGHDAVSGQDYLIMECVPGGELHGYAPSNSAELFLTLYQIACGLADIHAKNCIHRDLKPRNIKRDAQNIIKIIDFGIGSSTNPANTALGRGTNGYRGPEYYNSPTVLTSAADVYAFGAVAHKFCFGQLHPTLLHSPPQSPPSFQTARIGTAGESIPRVICDKLDSCLHSNPGLRPTATEIKELLHKHLVKGLHVASFVHGSQIYQMSNTRRGYTITSSQGTFQVTYNGLDFVLGAITGDVFVNGAQAANGTCLPGSCVITVGSGSGSNRAFIPFNVSYPEVVL